MLYKSELTGILLAGGKSQRYAGGKSSKLTEKLGSVSVLESSLIALSGFCTYVVLALSPDLLEEHERKNLIERAGDHGVILELVLGGERRQDSVLAALDCVQTDFLLIHDAARPCISDVDLEALLVALDKNRKAAILATPISDSLKRVNAENLIEAAVCRTGLWAAQTPQAFSSELYREAWALYLTSERRDELTDDACLFEQLGWPIEVVQSSFPNPKITYAQDLLLLRWIKEQKGRVTIVR